MSGAIVAFSLGSTIVKKSGIPGPTMAFYRMILTSVLWAVVLRVTEHRFVTRAELRRALVPGVVFGLNITAFFTGVTKTSVANAEFIGALTPVILVPVGAFVLKERINLRSLWFALVSLAGLMLVLFNTPTTGAASWSGNLFILMAMLSWATYLLTSRRMRADMSVQAILCSVMIVASFTIFPLALVSGHLDDLTMHSVPYVVGLALMTGTGAHGLIVYAQSTVPIGTISLLQVSQPALAVVWGVPGARPDDPADPDRRHGDGARRPGDGGVAQPPDHPGHRPAPRRTPGPRRLRRYARGDITRGARRDGGLRGWPTATDP